MALSKFELHVRCYLQVMNCDESADKQGQLEDGDPMMGYDFNEGNDLANILGGFISSVRYSACNPSIRTRINIMVILLLLQLL